MRYCSCLCRVVSLSSVHDVPRLALPAIADPGLASGTAINVGATHHTWNELVAIAEKVRGAKIEKRYVDGEEIKDLGADATGFMGTLGWFLMERFQKDPARHDFRETAYNVKHPEKYSGMSLLTVEEYLTAKLKQ